MSYTRELVSLVAQALTGEQGLELDALVQEVMDPSLVEGIERIIEQNEANYDAGHDAGYEAGHDDGFNSGYDEGYHAAEDQYGSDSYQDGYDDGYYQAGLELGRAEVD